MNLILILTFCFSSFLSIDSGNSSPVRDAQHNANLGVNDVETGDYQWVYNTSWAVDGGSVQLLQMRDMVIDDANNVYITGMVKTGTTSNDDAFIVKFDQNGQEVWNATFDGGHYDKGYGIALDGSNGVYIAGETANSSDYNWNAFIAKYDNDGNYFWNITWDGISGGSDSARDIILDDSGAIYIAGKTENTEDDVFIAKYDTSQNLVWNTTWDGGNSEKAYGIALDTSNNIYITGDVWTDHADLLLAKFNSTGHEKWNITLDGGYGSDYSGNGIALDSSNNIYIAGSIENNTNYDSFLVAKFDNDGNQEWNYTWDGGSGDDEALDLTIGESNNVYAVGETALSASNYDVIIKKIDNSGIEKWNITYNGGWTDTCGNAIKLDAEENIYIAGDYNGQNDAFIAKYQEIIPDENPINEENPDDDGDTTSPNAAAIPGYSFPIFMTLLSLILLGLGVKRNQHLKTHH
ncbi:MAG: hypothetical protein R6U96_13175 [Promethearchaeia archaeon]